MVAEVVDHPKRKSVEIPLSEDAIAVEVSRAHADDMIWCPQRGSWYVWEGSRWRRDERGVAFERVRNVCRIWSANEQNAKWGKHSVVASVERFCRTEQSLVVEVAELDGDPLLLGIPSGVVDLRTGEVRKASPADRITKQALVDPSADDDGEPERWLEFLNDATRGDRELISYLQRMAGYALTGMVREHALYFVYGPGGNGKGTFLNAIRAILGDYAVHAPVETFTEGFSRHPTELAMLQGARLVTASETEEGHAWKESRIKELTGGDPITARFVQKDFFTFQPQFKLIIIGNHQPVLKNVDDAARRRFRIIPFKFKPVEADLDLAERLEAEFPKILRWMIDGWLDMQAEDAALPDVVRRETFEYFEDQDAIGQWLNECCDTTEIDIGPDEAAPRCMSNKLFASWSAWATKNGELPGTNKRLTGELAKRGFRKKRGKHGVEFFRIVVKSENPAPWL